MEPDIHELIGAEFREKKCGFDTQRRCYLCRPASQGTSNRAIFCDLGSEPVTVWRLHQGELGHLGQLCVDVIEQLCNCCIL